MIIVKENGVRIMTPDVLPWLTKDDAWGRSIALGVNANPADWREATDEEHEEWEHRPPEEEATVEDYEGALEV